ncbi:hypothetical protein Maes01_02799 [Microbulbifer aestuariivivens]|uniref:Transposase n=1 Tax=Microbulbifer aestuariivivens TaxID=1908308 RepID=A0ABP9WSX3_9GAMM
MARLLRIAPVGVPQHVIQRSNNWGQSNILAPYPSQSIANLLC